MRKSFLENKLDAPATDGYDKLALVCSLGETKNADGYLMLGYDDIYSIQYFGDNLRLIGIVLGKKRLYLSSRKLRLTIRN